MQPSALDAIDKETELAIVRRAYAKQILAHARVSDPHMEAAFAQVAREHFLGPGPWETLRGPMVYAATPSDDPIYVYTDNLVGLRPKRGINNGQPSAHVALMAAVGVKPGDRVLHVGAGSGYYSAILAHIVGPGGRVTAIEIDPELAAWATTNLASVPNVSVVSGDAFTVSFDPVDVIYLNAGVARIPPAWLDGLRDGGRMILPMTSRTGFKKVEPGVFDPSKFARLAASHVVFRVERLGDEFHAKKSVFAAFIPAEGVDDDSDAALSAALEKGGANNVTRLYRRDDIPEDECWLRGKGWCLAYR
jgi:protein-L-isoaspartate(D-aspartate) O-methyltransferase